MIIVKSERAKKYEELLIGNGITTVFSTPGQGTARASVLEILGLERSEKTVLGAMATRSMSSRVMNGMSSALGINMPGGGIAFSVPVGSAGGSKALKWLLGEAANKANEVDKMTQQREFPFDLIIAVAQRDASGAVMDAARKAGARGGTIIHAKGTAGEYAEKFFGMTIAAEKELVLIVAKHGKKDDIMRSIMNNGKGDEPRAAVFSVPVETVQGMAGLESE